ncbi:MAG TPA: hypothetical protein VFA71_15015 [Terriglobales bacterium]|nr:hypothetical protein [Terriglobales bacterium]
MNNPLRDTPPDVIEKLTAWGGKNEFGDPYWRIILAQNHLVQRAGMWTEFAVGAEQARPTGIDYKLEFQQIAPDSIKTGMFWVPLYPVKGWVLERWFPPSSLGTRQAWEAALSQDNETPMMGPYPERGHYFMLDGPWEQIPNLEAVRRSISKWENDKTHLHGQFDEEKLLKTCLDADRATAEREQATYEAFLKEAEYAFNDVEFIKNNPALSAYRNQLLKREGFTSHA